MDICDFEFHVLSIDLFCNELEIIRSFVIIVYNYIGCYIWNMYMKHKLRYCYKYIHV